MISAVSVYKWEWDASVNDGQSDVSRLERRRYPDNTRMKSWGRRAGRSHSHLILTPTQLEFIAISAKPLLNLIIILFVLFYIKSSDTWAKNLSKEKKNVESSKQIKFSVTESFLFYIRKAFHFISN